MKRFGGRAAAAALGGALVLAAAVPAHAADGWNCEASAFRASVLGQPPAEPAVANRGAAGCESVRASEPEQPGAGPVSGGAIVAETTREGPAGTPSEQRLTARGGIGELRVRTPIDLPELPVGQLMATLQAVTVPLPAADVGAQVTQGLNPITTPLGNVPVIGGALQGAPEAATQAVSTLPGSITIDLRPALRALLPNGSLDPELVTVDGALAQAAGRCQGGTAAVSGRHQIGGLRILGQSVPTDQAIDRTVQLFDSTSIDPKQLDLSQIQLPPGLSFTDPRVGTILQSAVRGVLAALPPIQLPAQVARVRITPGPRQETSSGITQQALRIEASLGPQQLADITVGEAKVIHGALACGGAAAAPAPITTTQAALECTTRRLVLTDVYEHGGRVQLIGAADRRYVGRVVSIRFPHFHETVGRARVRQDGSFRTTAKLPPRAISRTNRARYQARIQKEASLSLKLFRRMVWSRVSSRDGKVILSGRVIPPLASPLRPIVVERRISCKRTEVVKRIRPRPDGTFRTTLSAPKGTGVAVYRLSTRVRKVVTNPKTYPTFTLPRAVELKR